MPRIRLWLYNPMEFTHSLASISVLTLMIKCLLFRSGTKQGRFLLFTLMVKNKIGM